MDSGQTPADCENQSRQFEPREPLKLLRHPDGGMSVVVSCPTGLAS